MKTTRYARYGPVDHYDGPPAAGMCLSVFVVLRRDNEVLVGIPKKVSRWRNEWLYSKNKDDVNFEHWRLPSCYLREGEDPNAALTRIMREQLGVRNFKASNEEVKTVSYYSLSNWYPGRSHWDLAFIYTIEVPKKDDETFPKKESQKYWKEIRFVKEGKNLNALDYGWNSDLISDLGLT